MHNSLRVCCLKRIANLLGKFHQLWNWHRPAGDAVPERLSSQQLHDKKRTLPIVAHVVNRADTRMIQSRGGASFALEATQCRWVRGERARKKLNGHRAVQTRVAGLIHLSHPARPQEFQYHVWPDPV